MDAIQYYTIFIIILTVIMDFHTVATMPEDHQFVKYATPVILASWLFKAPIFGRVLGLV